MNPTADTLEQSALGLLDYFDMTIGTLLLYKFERPLYSDLYAKECQNLGIKNGQEGPTNKSKCILEGVLNTF